MKNKHKKNWKGEDCGKEKAVVGKKNEFIGGNTSDGDERKLKQKKKKKLTLQEELSSQVLKHNEIFDERRTT
jgi:hypothetical protein